MQQCLLVSLMAIALLFTGCGGSGGSDPVGNSSIDFTTTGFSGSRPSMLNLIASADGTLNIPNSDGSEIVAAMNRQDGWALSQPIIMTMNSADGQNLAQPGFTANPAEWPLYLIEVNYDEEHKVPTTPVSLTQPFLIPGTDFSVLASDQTLYIIPLKPLNPGSYYSVILTNRLVDASGKALSAADSYVTARNSASTAAVDLAAKDLITAQEGIAAAIGVAQEDLVLTDTFRTTSVGDSLRMLKLAASTIVTNAVNGNRSTTATDVWSAGDSLSTTYEGIYDIDLSVASSGTLSQVLAASILGTPTSTQLLTSITNTPTLTPAANAHVFMTTVKLPYFLGHPGQFASAPLVTAWKGASDSLVSIQNGMSGDADTQTAITNALTTRNVDASRITSSSTPKGELATEILKLAGLNIQIPDGNGGMQVLDSERNVTRFNSLPALTILTDVPLLMFSPVNDLTNVDKVVIFQHGITSFKETAFFIAAGIISSGLAVNQNIAVAAIDLPLHGARSFPGGISTTSGSPEVYANLAYLTTARDNLRQSSADLLGLRAALSFANMQTPAKLGTAGNLKVSFVGHSLGGIVGTNFVAIANEISDYVGINNNMFKIDETILGMAGSMIAPIMLESATFGPTVKYLVANQDPVISQGFTAFVGSCEDSNAAMCFTTQFVTQQLSVEQQAELNSTFSQFSFAAQTVLDAVDPVGIARSIASTHPLLVMEVVGDKATNLADQVVPNAAGLAGTEILIRSLGLSDFTTTTGVTGQVHHAVRYSVGGHGSLIAPDANFDPAGAATAVMQAQMGTFFASNGLSLPTVNSNVICLDTAANCLP